MSTLPDSKLEIRPLVLGYLALNQNVKAIKFYRDINTVVKRLSSKGIPVDECSNKEVRFLLSFWQEQDYIEIKNNYISLTESIRNVFTEDFVTHKLFNRRCSYIPTVISTYSEVINNENNSRSNTRLCRRKQK